MILHNDQSQLEFKWVRQHNQQKKPKGLMHQSSPSEKLKISLNMITDQIKFNDIFCI